MLSKPDPEKFLQTWRSFAAIGIVLLASTLSACGGGDTVDGGVENEDQSQTLAGDTGPQAGAGESQEPTPTPTAPANTTPFAGDITDVILVTGQSNALGADTEFDPRGDPSTDPSNNFGFHFAKKVAERRSHRVVGIILVTAPGEPIATWDYESEFYLSIRDRVISALNQLPSKATIDGILWHQGETDWEDTPYYENKLADVINNFRSESWFASDKPFICGETSLAPLNRILMNLNSDGDQWTGCVESDGLRTHEDQVHFTADGLRVIGTRYATKYLQLIEQ